MRGWAGNGVQEAILKWNTPIDNTYYNKIGNIENTHTPTSFKTSNFSKNNKRTYQFLDA